jgi:hypothetical protein
MDLFATLLNTRDVGEERDELGRRLACRCFAQYFVGLGTQRRLDGKHAVPMRAQGVLATHPCHHHVTDAQLVSEFASA